MVKITPKQSSLFVQPFLCMALVAFAGRMRLIRQSTSRGLAISGLSGFAGCALATQTRVGPQEKELHRTLRVLVGFSIGSAFIAPLITKRFSDKFTLTFSDALRYTAAATAINVIYGAICIKLENDNPKPRDPKEKPNDPPIIPKMSDVKAPPKKTYDKDEIDGAIQDVIDFIYPGEEKQPEKNLEELISNMLEVLKNIAEPLRNNTVFLFGIADSMLDIEEGLTAAIILDIASEKVLQSEDFVCKYIKEYGTIPKLHDSLSTNSTFMMKMIKQEVAMAMLIDGKLLEDDGFVLKSYWEIKRLLKSQKIPDNIEQKIKDAFARASKNYSNNSELLLPLIKEYKEALEIIGDDLQSDSQFMKKVILASITVKNKTSIKDFLQKAPKGLRKDTAFLIEAAKKIRNIHRGPGVGIVLDIASEEVFRDQNFVKDFINISGIFKALTKLFSKIQHFNEDEDLMLTFLHKGRGNKDFVKKFAEELSQPLRENADFLLKALKVVRNQDCSEIIYNCASEKVLKNEAFVCKYIKKYGAPPTLHSSFSTDPEFMMRVIKEKVEMAMLIDEKLFKHDEFTLKSYWEVARKPKIQTTISQKFADYQKVHQEAFEKAAKKYSDEPKLLLPLIKEYAAVLDIVGDALLKDETFMEEAINIRSSAIDKLHEELLSNSNFILKLLGSWKGDVWIAKVVPLFKRLTSLKEDSQFMLKAAIKYSSIMRFADESLFANRDCALKMISCQPKKMHLAAIKHPSDDEIILKILECNKPKRDMTLDFSQGHLRISCPAFKFKEHVSEDLRGSLDFMKKAAAINPKLANDATDKLKKSRDFQACRANLEK